VIRKGPSPETENEWQASLSSAVDTLAGLTAVDGATLISDDYEVLAFGAKIKRASGANKSNRWC